MKLEIGSEGITGHLREGLEERVLANLCRSYGDIVIESVTISYHIRERSAPGVIPNIDPHRGYEGDSPAHGEGAHPHDDATGHVTRTHDDFGPRLRKEHTAAERDITQLPSWGGVGC